VPSQVSDRPLELGLRAPRLLMPASIGKQCLRATVLCTGTVVMVHKFAISFYRSVNLSAAVKMHIY